MRKGILLAAVQQEEVKRLLDFLLALDGKHLPLLGRDGSHPSLCPLLTALRVGALHLDAYDEIVYGTDDVLLGGTQQVVQLFHHRIALAAFACQLIALQLGGIVACYLVFDIHVADARIGRNQFGIVFRVGEIFLDVTSKPQLGFQFKRVGVVFLRLVHIHIGGSLDIDHLVHPLEGFEVGLHVA